MKPVQWLGWAGVAAGLAYVGRELLAVKRLTEQAEAPAAAAGASEPAKAGYGGFYSTAPASSSGLTASAVMDKVLGTSAPSPAPGGAPSGAPPKLVETDRAGRAHARLGGAVLLDKQHRWELVPQATRPPRASTAAATAPSVGPGSSGVAPPALTLPVDKAALDQRRQNAINVLRWMGAIAVVLLAW